jgi:hypothetical protein
MESTSPRKDVCSLCGEALRPGERAFFGHGEVYHLACHVQSGGAVDSVSSLLQRNAGLAYCHSCLAAALAVSFAEARKAVDVVRLYPGFTVQVPNVCSICHIERVTITARPWARVSDPGAATDQAAMEIAKLLERSASFVFCDACLSLRLHMTLAEGRAAAAALGGKPGFVRTVRTCYGCDRILDITAPV